MFDKKAWAEANREKVKLYSVRARLKKKGLASPETTEQMMAERAAKKAAPPAPFWERRKMADWENLAKKLEAVTVLETYENGSQLVQNAHPDGFLAAAVIREQAARISALEEALKECAHDLEASHNLRATDMAIKAFDDALARGVGRDCLEFTIDNSRSLRAARTAMEGER